MTHTLETALAGYTKTCGRCGFAISGYRNALQYSIGDQWSWDGQECVAICECPQCRASFSVPKFSGSAIWDKGDNLLSSR